MKQIIEDDTDPMKEMLCLGATFAPTQQIMFSSLVQRGKPRPRFNPTPTKKNYVVKFGPRRETMKEIIEADTDPMKEVTFAPTHT